MHQIKFGLLFLIAITLAGCGVNDIDTTSDEAMQKSLARVRESLSKADEIKFDESLRLIMFADVNGLAALSNPKAIETGFKARLHGKTGSEVIAEGRKVREKRRAADQKNHEENQKAQAKREMVKQQNQIIKLEELKSQMDSSAADEEFLHGFVVEQARFYFEESGFVTQPFIEITVLNKTTSPIGRAYFEGTLATPGRSVPWVQDNFVYKIRGGLEPAERATWKLHARSYGGWNQAPRDREDMILYVRPIQLEGANGENLAQSGFDSDDAAKMLRLAGSLPADFGIPYIDALNQMQERRAADMAAQQKVQLEVNRRFQVAQRTEKINQIRLEINELLELRSGARADQALRDRFRILRSRFYFNEGVLGKEPVFEISVMNETGKPITRVHFEAVLSSPNRASPWLEDTFNYQIRGGIESGEHDTWTLSPNRFSNWGNLPDNRDDMVLALSVQELDGVDGQTLFGTEYSSEDEAHLKVLQNQIAEFDSANK